MLQLFERKRILFTSLWSVCIWNLSPDSKFRCQIKIVKSWKKSVFSFNFFLQAFGSPVTNLCWRCLKWNLTSQHQKRKTRTQKRWLMFPPGLRCIITGMASGSIVLFYNDFNRWHHEYQTRYWANGAGRWCLELQPL